jgi:GNAT superfamily N-acetyltransferase
MLEPISHLKGVQLVVVGDGPRRAKLERAMPKAIFTGQLTGAELGRAMASLDLLVHPGADETFCQVIQEGLCAGVPVIAAASGGPLDLVRHGDNGWLWAGDDPETLAAQVCDVRDNPAQRAVVAARTRPSVVGRTWASVTDQLLVTVGRTNPHSTCAPSVVDVVRKFHEWRHRGHVTATPAAQCVSMTTRPATVRPLSRIGTGSPRPTASANHERARAPWYLYIDGTILTVRGATSQDLPGVALMHSRCSAKTLLDRYRVGGRSPAVLILDRHVREPLSFVVTADDGRVVAMALVSSDTAHTFGSGEVAMIVEDDWQQLGIGKALLRHTAAAAQLCGYRQLISYPGTTVTAIQQLMQTVGTTRVIADTQRHLHTSLPDSARFGLGSAGRNTALLRRSTAALG